MRLDAWEDQQVAQIQQSNDPRDHYIPGYDPDNDGWYDVNWKPDYTADLHLASQEFWKRYHREEDPPAPSYRAYKPWKWAETRRMLGREMDVYGCQAMMRSARHQYQSRLYASIIGGIISLGSFAAAGGVGIAISIVLILIVVPPLALFVRWHYNEIYRRYYYAQAEILKTGQPVWVPYSRKDLRRIKTTAGPIWP